MTAPDYCERVLVIPDAHAHPQYPNERFSQLGRLIKQLRPSHVVCLGDFADMPSLSSFDKGRLSFEGRRYVRDVEVTRDALRLLHEAAGSGAEWHITLGNHEYRINKIVSGQSELEGTMSDRDLGFEEHGWRITPYKHQLHLAGWTLTHCVLNRMDRPIGGINHAKALIRWQHTSTVVGHSHCLDYALETATGGRRVHGIVAGHIGHEEAATETWCVGASHTWWSGVIVMDAVRDGDAESIQFLTRERIEALTADPTPHVQSLDLDWDEDESATSPGDTPLTVESVAAANGVTRDAVTRWLARMPGRQLHEYTRTRGGQ